MQEVHWSFINPYIWTIVTYVCMYSYVAKGVGVKPRMSEELEQAYFSDYVHILQCLTT